MMTPKEAAEKIGNMLRNGGTGLDNRALEAETIALITQCVDDAKAELLADARELVESFTDTRKNIGRIKACTAHPDRDAAMKTIRALVEWLIENSDDSLADWRKKYGGDM